MKLSPFKNPLCVALDVSDETRAWELVEELSDLVGGFKLGPRLLMRSPGILKKISARVPTFVDCKFFDIPTVMEAAVESCFEEGASLVTVHAMAGVEALQLLAKVESRLNKIRPFRVLAVSILTSWSEKSYPPILKQGAPSEHVQALAKFADEAGINGLVCSAQELAFFQGQERYLVTPGIRRDADDIGDQKRTLGPREAQAAGASLLVVGRPIIAANDPRKEAQAFLDELSL